MVYFFLVICFLYLHELGAYHLIDPDEGRYHEIAREMIFTGDYITPHLNGVEYFEKPVLQYWITAFFMNIFGITEAAGRIFPALASIGTVCLTGILGAKIFDSWRTGLLAAGILATSVITIAVGSMNILDMGLTLWLTGTMVSYYFFKADGKKKYLYLFYVFMALAMLQKGLIAIVLPGLIIFILGIYYRNWRIWTEVLYWPAILLGLAVATPWFYFVAEANPDFMYFFFVHEHFLRFTTKIHQRFHPWWFFIPFLLLGFSPWTGFFTSLFSKHSIVRSPKDKKEKDNVAFLMIWWLAIFVFFSISDSKLVPYIMPCFIPLAILLAGSMARCDHLGKWLGGSLWVSFGWNIFFGVALVMADYFYKEVNYELFVSHSYPLLAITFMIPVIMFLAWKTFNRIRCTLTCTFIVACFAAVALQYFQVGIYDNQTSYYVSQRIMTLKEKPDLIVNYKDYYHGTVFYTGERVALAEFKGELEFGSQHSKAGNYFLDNGGLADLWKSDKRIIIVVKAKNLEACLQALPFAPKFEEKVQDYIILSNKIEN